MNAIWHLTPELTFLLSLLLGVAFGGLAVAWVTRLRRAVISPRYTVEARAVTEESFVRGFDLLLDARWQEAAHVLSAAVKDDPTRLLEYLELGKLWRRRGDYSRAARIFEQLLVRPELEDHIGVVAQYELALAYRSLGWQAEAAARLERVVALQPCHAEARQELRRLHEELGQWETAAALELLRLQRGEASERRTLAALLTQQGKAVWAAGNIQSAAAHLRSALALDPKGVEAVLSLGQLCLRQGEISEAFGLWDHLARQRPEFLYLAFRDIQAAFRQQHDDSGWERFLHDFTERHPGDPAGYLALAEWYEARGQVDEALSYLQQVLDLDPLCREAHMALLSLYRAQEATHAIFERYAQLVEHCARTCISHCRCLACGAARDEPFDKCPSCHAWGTAVRRIPETNGVPVVTGQLASLRTPASSRVFTPLATTRDPSHHPAADR